MGRFSIRRATAAWRALPGAWRTLPWAAALAATLLAGCNPDEPAPPPAAAAPPPPEVTVVAVAARDLPVETEFAGRTAGSREVEVRARVEGILLERTYVEGERVAKGDTLFRIDPRPYQVALQRAEAQLQEAQARQRAAERNLRRAEALFRKQAASERTRDDALSETELAKAAVALARAEVNAARIDLDYTTVKAPISGETGQETVSEGSLVGTTRESGLLTRITQLDPIYVNFAIPDAVWLRQRELRESGRLVLPAGGPLAAEMRLADGQVYPHHGSVDFTGTTVDRATGTIQARAVFPNPDGDVLPGQFVRVVLMGLVRKNAIVVPEKAVMQGPQGTFVYRLDGEDKAQVAPVKTGPTVAEGWIIDDGPAPGDRVVAEGVIKVRPGQPVRVAAAGEAAGETADGAAAKTDGAGK